MPSLIGTLRRKLSRAYCLRSVKRPEIFRSTDQSFALRRVALVVVAGSIADMSRPLGKRDPVRDEVRALDTLVEKEIYGP